MGFQGSIGSPRCSADAQRASPLAFPSQVGGKSHRALHPNRFAPDPSPRPRHSKQWTIDRGSPGRGPSLCPARARAYQIADPEKKATRIASDRGHARDLCCRVRRSRRPLLLFLLHRRWIFMGCARCLHGAHFMSLACVHDVFFSIWFVLLQRCRAGSFMAVEGNDVRSEHAVRRKRRWRLRTRLHSP